MKNALKKTVAALGFFTLSTAQTATIIVAIFTTIPLVLTLFLGVQYNRVLSGSMEPTFSTGDLVLTQPAVGGELVKGAIVGVKSGDVQYAHRVVEVHEDGTATTQGDANNTADLHRASQDELWGVVVNIIPQPWATTMTLFTINTQWFANPSVEAAPWGFAGLVVAILLVWWIIPDCIVAYERRAARAGVQQPVNPFTNKHRKSASEELTNGDMANDYHN